jgi:hypothetical protein
VDEQQANGAHASADPPSPKGRREDRTEGASRKGERDASRKRKAVSVQLSGERHLRKVKVTASFDRQVIHRDTIDLDSATQRERFTRALGTKVPGADLAAVETELLKLSDTLAPEERAASVGVEPADPAKVVLSFNPGLKGRMGTVTAELGGEAVYLDNTVDPCNAKHRERFLNALLKKIPTLDRADAERQLSDIAGQRATEMASGLSTGEKPGTRDPADLLAEMPQDIRDEAERILNDPLLIQHVVEDVAALGVAGERQLTATLYLIGTSRLLERPLAGIVQGPSSSGKSYLIEKVASLFPPETVIHATQMTPQALFHMRPGALAHKFIVAGERSRIEDDEQAEATRALREMLSAGKLSKLMPIKIEGGRIETVPIEQEGPIAYVESTTLAKVFEEDATRCLQLHTDEQPNQTRRIITTLANGYGGCTSGAKTDHIVQRHFALQRLLKPLPVVIPYADRLGELFTTDRVEARRAFPQAMSMIQGVALLHQYQRSTDSDGRLLATADDYHLSRRLLARPMARLLGGGLSDPARRFFDRLQTWAAGQTFTSTEAKGKERNCKSSVYGWLHELHEAGLVEVVQPARGKQPATWRLTGNQPVDGGLTALPALEMVFPDPSWKHGNDAQPVAAL